MKRNRKQTFHHQLIHISYVYVLIFTSFFLTGCLPDKAQQQAVQSSLISGTDFSGISKVTNINGPLKIEWIPSLKTVKNYVIYHQNSFGDFDLVATVDATKSYYVHGSSESLTTSFMGRIHTYRVRAVDTKGVEDGNTKTLSSISYPGITSVIATGKTTAKVNLPSVSPSFDEIRIYAKAAFIPDSNTLVGTAASDQTEINITGLKSGLTYVFSAQAYSDYMGVEDGNTITTNVQTGSYTAEGYNGIFHVQAYGPAPNAPSFQPKTKMVILSWVNFSNGGSGTQYRVIRTAKDGFITTNPTTSTGALLYCTPSTTTSCVVNGCENVNHITNVFDAIGPTCLDDQVGDSPSVYDYSVLMIRGSGASLYAEELELGNQDLYRIRIPVPPKNMALVHRDAVNFEMCQLLHSETNPLAHQRCSFNGYGAVPMNSGPGGQPLGLPSDHFDFGYNLFVDRWELGCDYDEFLITGTGSIDGTVATAKEGKVIAVSENDKISIWATGGTAPQSMCRLARNGKWYGTGYASGSTLHYPFTNILNDPLVKNLFTNDPLTRSNKKSISQIMTLNQSWSACQTQVDPDYGAKRVPRMREFRAYAAFPWIKGEYMHDGTSLFSSALDSTQMTKRLISTSHSVGGATIDTRGCATYGGSLVSWGDVVVPANRNDLLADLGDRNSKVLFPTFNSSPIYSTPFTGSQLTSGCLTRYGLQDVVGNQKEYVSDRFSDCNPRPILNTYGTSTNDLCYNNDPGNGSRCAAYTLDFALEPTTYNTTTCALVSGVAGNCPAKNQVLPAGYVKYCTGAGGGLDSGNIDLSPFSVNPLLPDYVLRVSNTSLDYTNYKISAKTVFGSYFNPILGLPSYDSTTSYTFTATYGAPTDYTKNFSATPGDLNLVDNLTNATVSGLPGIRLLQSSETIVFGDRGKNKYLEYSGGGSYKRKILAGGSNNSATLAGRWQTDIYFQPTNDQDYLSPDHGVRCVLPAE